VGVVGEALDTEPAPRKFRGRRLPLRSNTDGDVLELELASLSKLQ
jgi:hypothetical protein